jgi:hypothetical protein
MQQGKWQGNKRKRRNYIRACNAGCARVRACVIDKVTKFLLVFYLATAKDDETFIGGMSDGRARAGSW